MLFLIKTDLPKRTSKTLKKLKMLSVLSGSVWFTFQQTGKMRQFLDFARNMK